MPFLRFRKCIRWSRRLFSAPLKMRSMWQVLFRETLKMRSVPEKAVFDTEYHFRTVEACFLHRMLLKMRRVPEDAVLRTECPLRTVGGRFRYRVLTGKLLPLRNFELHKRKRPTLVDLVQYSANSYLLSWNLVHPSLKKATICLAAASPALMLASAV